MAQRAGDHPGTGSRLDRAYLEEAAPMLGVADLLVRALREGADCIYLPGGAVSLDATRRLNFQTPFSRTKVSS